MLERRKRNLLIYLVGFIALSFFAVAALDPKILLNSHDLSRMAASLLCGMLGAGLFIWFWEGRKYYGFAKALVQFVVFGGLGISEWTRGSRMWGVAAFASAVGLIMLFDEIREQRLRANTQPSAIQAT